MDKSWTMPEWMEPYRDHFYSTGGNTVEYLMDAPNLDKNLSRTNMILFTLCMMAEAQVAILSRLHSDNLLREEDAKA